MAAPFRKLRTPMFMLTLANFISGNKRTTVLKQLFISCKLIVNVCLVSTRQILSILMTQNVNFDHFKNVTYFPAKNSNKDGKCTCPSGNQDSALALIVTQR